MSGSCVKEVILAQITFTVSDEEKELIKKIASESAYKNMSKYCAYIIVNATKAVDNALHGTEYDCVHKVETDTDITYTPKY